MFSALASTMFGKDRHPVSKAESKQDDASTTALAAAAACAGPDASRPLMHPRAPLPSPDARAEFCGRLAAVPVMTSPETDALFMHGRAYEGPGKAPTITWRSNKPPRDDHDCPAWLTASEYSDSTAVMNAKVRQLAALIRMSKKTVLYTGAGISASVIGQAARSGTNVVGWKKGDRMAAHPTYTHKALGLLGRAGLVHSWVQQNHDGLPQKGGFPQENINEIHGSWFDPSNPVVKYSGSLHERAFPWMLNDAETADLVIVIGTSLGGLNADRVATETAERSLMDKPWDAAGGGGALGTVIINLQMTPVDGQATLRMFGKSDDVLRRLLSELGLGPVSVRLPGWGKDVDRSFAMVPYDKDGRRLRRRPAAEGGGWDGPLMRLDLRDRQRVRITPGHNIQGARQPMYMHIGAKTAKTAKKAAAGGRGAGETRSCPGHGHVVRKEEFHWQLQIEGVGMRLGVWWLEAAARGAVDVLPIANLDPTFEAQHKEEDSVLAVAAAAGGAARGAGGTTTTKKKKKKKKKKKNSAG